MSCPPLCAGVWRYIVQSSGLSQPVAVDRCLLADAPCPGLADCGRKSRCVQRFNYHLLLALDGGETGCPVLRAFRLPSGCVCHAETSE